MSSEEIHTAQSTPSSKEHIRDAVTSDYVSGVKERSALNKEIAELTKELNHIKAKNYDLLKKVEQLEKEVGNVFLFTYHSFTNSGCISVLL